MDIMLVKQSFSTVFWPDPDIVKVVIEAAGRTCYKSEDKITPESASKFMGRIYHSGHHSVLEHISITFRFITNRAITHELVRHRLASYSQESTRYCNYNKKGYTFIRPSWVANIPLGLINEVELQTILRSSTITHMEHAWLSGVIGSIRAYENMLDAGASVEEARGQLNHDIKAEIVMTANLREWHHVLRLRTGKAAHFQIRELLLPVWALLVGAYPEIYKDITPAT